MAGPQKITAIYSYGAQRALGVAAANAVRSGMLAFSDEMPRVLSALGESLTARAIPEGQVKKVNIDLAQGAHGAMIAHWRERLPRNFTYDSPSRLSGTLKPALENMEKNTAGTTDRIIKFVNANWMGNEAKHWHRVNYGSGAAFNNGNRAETFTTSFNGQPVLQLRDDTPHASLHLVPVNIYGSGHHFFPGKPTSARRGDSLTREGRGTRAARFTDVGLAYLADQKTGIGAAYYKMFVAFISDPANVRKLQGFDIKVGANLTSGSQRVVITNT